MLSYLKSPRQHLKINTQPLLSQKYQLVLPFLGSLFIASKFVKYRKKRILIERQLLFLQGSTQVKPKDPMSVKE